MFSNTKMNERIKPESMFFIERFYSYKIIIIMKNTKHNKGIQTQNDIIRKNCGQIIDELESLQLFHDQLVVISLFKTKTAKDNC